VWVSVVLVALVALVPLAPLGQLRGIPFIGGPVFAAASA